MPVNPQILLYHKMKPESLSFPGVSAVCPSLMQRFFRRGSCFSGIFAGCGLDLPDQQQNPLIIRPRQDKTDLVFQFSPKNRNSFSAFLQFLLRLFGFVGDEQPALFYERQTTDDPGKLRDSGFILWYS